MRWATLFLYLWATLSAGCVTRLRVNVDVYQGSVFVVERARQAIAVARAVTASSSGENKASVNVADAVRKEAPGNTGEATSKANALDALLTLVARRATELEKKLDAFEKEKSERKRQQVILTLDGQSTGLIRLLDAVRTQSQTLAEKFKSAPSEQEEEPTVADVIGKQSVKGANKTDQSARKQDGSSSPQPLQPNPALEKLLLGLSSGAAVAGADDSTGRVVGWPLFERLLPRILAEQQLYNHTSLVPFNSISSRTFGGDTQFVVVREGLASFQQKNLDFDPTPVIGAGSAMARLGLKIAASVASGYVPGLASSLPANGGTSANPISSRATLNEPQMEQQRVLLRSRAKERMILLDALRALLASGVDAAKARTLASQALEHYRRAISLPNEPADPVN